MGNRCVGLSIAALLLLAAGMARAQSCAPEQEPNDDAAVAQPVKSAFCIAGAAEDGPDILRWYLGPKDAVRLWSLKLEGLPGESATIAIEPADGSAPSVSVDGTTDVEVPEQAFAAGDYLVTVTVAGAPGLYRLTAIPGGPVPAVESPAVAAAAPAVGEACATEEEPNDDATTAGAVPAVFCVGGSAADGPDSFRWSLGPDDVGTFWSLALQSLPGQSVTVEVRSIDPATGETSSLTSEYGDYSALDLAIPDRIYTPGDYLIVVTVSGGAGLYHLSSARGAPLPPTDPDATTSGITNATTVIASSGDYGATIPWRLDPPGSGQRWDIGVEAPVGKGTTLTLTDANGSQITYAYTGEDGVARLSDVAAEAGDYQLQVSGSLVAGDPLLVETVPAGPRGPGYETEPDDDISQAFPFDPATGVTGRLVGNSGSSDRDYFDLTLDDSWRDRQFDLVLKAPETSNGLTLALVDETGNDLQARSGSGEVRLVDLVMPPGTVRFQVRGALPAEQSYTVALEPRGTVGPGAEREPNDSIALASPLDPAQGATGRFYGDEADVFSFIVEGEPQLWRIAVDGPAGRRFTIDDTGGGQTIGVAKPSDGDGAEISNVLLVPGRHVLGLYGADGPYTIALAPLGRPDLARDELEPDDDLAHALPLYPGIERTGLLDHPGDGDYYRFSLAGDAHVRLTVTGIAGIDLSAPLYWSDTNARVGTLVVRQDAAGAAVWDGILQAGDYYLALSGSDISTTPYKVLLEPQPYYARQTDIEPNSKIWQASPLPPDLRIAGTLNPDDADWYRLPDLAQDTDITIRSRIGADDAFGTAYLSVTRRTPLADGGFWPRWETSRVADIEGGDEPGTWHATVPAGEGLYLGLEGGNGAYDLDLSIPGQAAAAASAAPPVTVGLALADAPVAAFTPDGQVIDGTITLANTGSQALSLDLASHAGDARWQVALDLDKVELPAGGNETVPVRVTVAPQALAGIPVAIEVAASLDGGPAVSAAAMVTPTAGVRPTAPVAVPPLPEALLGGLNVAWSGFGATMVDDGDARLIDGLSSNSTTARFDRDMLAAVRPTVRLAGDEPVALAGVVLERGIGSVASRLAEFTISVSTDGTDFKPVLDARMSAAPAEQAFAFAEPVKARFVRLEPRGNQSGDAENYGADLGELKAIAVPGTTLRLPSDPDGFDVARADRGGHVVRKSIDIDTGTTLTDGDEALQLYLSDEQRALGLEWVVAFRANRAAEIRALTWTEGEAFDPTRVVPSVRVAVATEGADGPWTDLGRWTPERDGAGQARLDLPEPVWARYVRFTADVPTDGTTPVLPARIGILERPVDRDHPSILGEWGLDRPAAIFERSVPTAVADAPATADAAGATRDAAALLAPDKAVAGSVRLGVREDWYRLKVPADRPHLTLELGGRPAGAVALTVEDAQGTEVALSETDDGDTRIFQADLAPGGYFVRITEPPRSVILSWDTSISVSPYTPEIVQSIMSFVSQIEPGREEVNLIPFSSDDGTRPLLDQWSDDPLVVYSALQGYGWADTSSNAEAALAAANEAFRGRPGTHAILIITDGESNGSARNPAVWAGFDRERPRIFSVAVPTDSAVPDVLKGRSMLQDWAMLNAGNYRVMSSTGSVASAFAELTASLQAPAGYTLTARLDVPPVPGRIAVTAAADAPPDQPPLVADQAIEIIVDLSGSMLQRIDGERKSEIAKSILTDLVTASLPAGLPFALRVFGQGGPGSCDTGLVSALAPLDPATVAGVIAPIEPTNLAKTPIAASLAAVRDDLAGATGKRLVILITDGEETCDGDPKAEIAGLRDAGIDVRINIVGFALDDAALKDTFRDWAKQGGGAFFEATDKDTLAVAMDAAVRPEFDVLDAQGAVVGHGTVGGEPIEVPAGPYTVRILSAPEREISDVTVAPGEITTVAAE